MLNETQFRICYPKSLYEISFKWERRKLFSRQYLRVGEDGGYVYTQKLTSPLLKI